MMDIKKWFDENEKPLDNLIDDAGFCGIFRRVACIGDSLSSGEFEAVDENGKHSWHDEYEYSWGQYMARTMGSKVYNFSKGGMTAKEYCTTFGNARGFFNNDKLCQAYIIAMGVNDICGKDADELGDVSDIDLNDWHNNKETVIGYYAQIIQRYKELQPKARFFLVTIPQSDKRGEDLAAKIAEFANQLNKMAEMFEYTYVIDLHKYAPVYDDFIRDKFFMEGHMNPMGYMFTAKMMMSYIDYIIRHNVDDFRQVGFIGAPYHNVNYKW